MAMPSLPSTKAAPGPDVDSTRTLIPEASMAASRSPPISGNRSSGLTRPGASFLLPKPRLAMLSALMRRTNDGTVKCSSRATVRIVRSPCCPPACFSPARGLAKRADPPPAVGPELRLCGKAKDFTSAPKAIETGAGDGRSFTAQRRKAEEESAPGAAAQKAHAHSGQHLARPPPAEEDGRQGPRRQGGEGRIAKSRSRFYCA